MYLQCLIFNDLLCDVKSLSLYSYNSAPSICCSFVNIVLNMWKAIATFFVYANVAMAEKCDTDQRLAVMEAKLDLMMQKCKLIYKLAK